MTLVDRLCELDPASPATTLLLGGAVAVILVLALLKPYRDLRTLRADAAVPHRRGDAAARRALLERFASTYPEFTWVGLAEAAGGRVLAATGTVFEHEIAVAVPTPQATAGQFRMQALIGAIVGLLPVAIGTALPEVATAIAASIALSEVPRMPTRQAGICASSSPDHGLGK